MQLPVSSVARLLPPSTRDIQQNQKPPLTGKHPSQFSLPSHILWTLFCGGEIEDNRTCRVGQPSWLCPSRGWKDWAPGRFWDMLGVLKWVTRVKASPSALVAFSPHITQLRLHRVPLLTGSDREDGYTLAGCSTGAKTNKNMVEQTLSFYSLIFVSSRKPGLGTIWLHQLLKCLLSQLTEGCGRLSTTDQQESRDRAGNSHVQGAASWEKRVVSVSREGPDAIVAVKGLLCHCQPLRSCRWGGRALALLPVHCWGTRQADRMCEMWTMSSTMQCHFPNLNEIMCRTISKCPTRHKLQQIEADL